MYYTLHSKKLQRLIVSTLVDTSYLNMVELIKIELTLPLINLMLLKIKINRWNIFWLKVLL